MNDQQPRDDFAALMAEEMKDPAFARHYNEAKARLDRAEPVLCAWRNCVHDVDPEDGKIIGGMGPIACPCDHLPGWKSDRVEGQARPAAPVKARGRHGSRVQRSRKRHTLGSWMDAFGGWLPASIGVSGEGNR